MIARYTRPEMEKVFSTERKLEKWFQVEMAVCTHMVRLSLIPKEDFDRLKKSGARLQFDQVFQKDMARIENRVKHDVIAFTTALAKRLGKESRYIHYGLTSSDVVDTAFSLQLREAGQVLMRSLRELKSALLSKAEKYRDLRTIGRSHGMFAEPTTYGLKFLGFFKEWERQESRLARALEQIGYGKLSGAVGANTLWSERDEAMILKNLKLRREPVATQVLPRDRHAELLCTIAMMGSSLERLAIELRHLQRSEVGEFQEPFSVGQKGSSAMPHKKNPISSENLTGCARLLRSYAVPALENIALWHERDISHSAVERVIVPDAFIVCDYALHRMSGIVRQGVVHVDRVGENLAAAGDLIYSGHLLVKAVEKKLSREQAYRAIQKAAHAKRGSFIENLLRDRTISSRLSREEIESIVGGLGESVLSLKKFQALVRTK